MIIMELEDDALWVIVDPWFPTPFDMDLKQCPNIDELNGQVIDKIVKYLPKLKHVCVSCPTIINDSELHVTKKVHVHPKLKHLYNFKNDYSDVLKYMRMNNLNKIVYCGFHYGDCILYNDDGVVNTSKKFKVFVKKELCGIFPGSISWDSADKKTKKYARVI